MRLHVEAPYAPVEKMESGPAFSFPRELRVFGEAIRVTDTNAEVLRPLLEPWLPDVQVGQPMFAVLVVVGLVALPTIGAGLLAPALFAAMAFLEGHFVTPMIVGRRLALNALAVFIALAFWTWLWGPMGAFLSSPLLIVGLIVKEHLMPSDQPQLPED